MEQDHPKTAREVALTNLAKAWKVPRGPGKYNGVQAFLSTAVAPKGKEIIARKVDALVARMAKELGGVANLTGQEMAVLWSQRVCLTIMMIACERLQAEGLTGDFLDGRGKPVGINPIVDIVGPFSDRARRNAQVLGLERKKGAAAEDSLESVLKEIHGKDIAEPTESQGGEGEENQADAVPDEAADVMGAEVQGLVGTITQSDDQTT